jgi:DNA-binding LacI/PurR family transcriptional regulator
VRAKPDRDGHRAVPATGHRSRLHGYEDALRAAGLEPGEDLVVEGDWTPHGGAAATRLLLEQ